MGTEVFKFKQFSIEQNDSVFKVGTDGVLLGAWTDTVGAKNVLDIGTGTGLLALLIAQKTKDTLVDAIEVQEESCKIAETNFERSPWKNRIKLIQSTFQNFASMTDKGYDLILSNPPFFIDSLKSPAAGKSLSRHAESLSMEDLLAGVLKLLKPGGRLSVIYPFKEAGLFTTLALERKLHCRRRMLVRPLPDRPFVRTLMEFSFEKVSCDERELAIETGPRHHYSEAYKTLTGEFYLYFLH
jgi:tRNA1Val (adenine37-N6)-methyltransferase